MTEIADKTKAELIAWAVQAGVSNEELATFIEKVTAPPGHIAVKPDPGSRLAQLQAAYPEAKAARDESKTRFESIVQGIKAETEAIAPGVRDVDLDGDVPLHYFDRASGWFDVKTFKIEEPEMYARYYRRGTTKVLEAKKGSNHA